MNCYNANSIRSSETSILFFIKFGAFQMQVSPLHSQQPLVSSIGKKEIQQTHQSKSNKKRKKIEQWTEEQDCILINGIREFGNKWKEIADQCFTTPAGNYIREANNCYHRYRYHWKQRYSIENIQSIQGPIQISGQRKCRQIDRIFQLAKQENDLTQIAGNFPHQFPQPPHLTAAAIVENSNAPFPSPQSAAWGAQIQSVFSFSIQKRKQTNALAPLQQEMPDRNKKFLRWKAEEDQRLLEAIKKCGDDWLKISFEYFTTPQGVVLRTDTSCYDRYRYSWKKFYSIEQIQSMEDPISEIILRGNRILEIANSFLVSEKKNQSETTTVDQDSFDSSATPSSSSSLQHSTGEQVASSDFSANEIPFLDPEKIDEFFY